mgnify:CR=1 FL=1
MQSYYQASRNIEISQPQLLGDIEADICNVGGAWQRINVAIRRALGDINLADLQTTRAPVPRFDFAGLPINVEGKDSKHVD